MGRGGVAVVHAATDLATGERVALKRLRAQDDPALQQRIVELFEREYHTLAQLAHPHIVRVYDYGIDAEGPYYTMEMVDGGDLQQLAPLPWRRACAIARDVCSALSLLHSRRLVHRDISPRNVRCGRDGRAKLLDFGALAPFGANKFLVGTPGCCAPESVNLQPLDGRADLYGLGATLYYLVVGRHAYLARHFSALSECWLNGFVRPSQLTPDLPPALDELLLDLLRLEPDARPASAAEVMQRLSAIDGETDIEQQRVARAYLVTPTLVGREEQLARVKRKLDRTLNRGRGNSLVVSGPAGVGRSRFLDACVLEATLLGASVVRTDADDAASGEWGVLRALVRQLFTIMPQAALEASRPHAGVLARFAPEVFVADLSEAATLSLRPSQPEEGVASRSQLQAALQAWLTALCRRRPLLVAVDDFGRIDEPSAALLSLLSHDVVDGLCLLVTTEMDAPVRAPAAQRLVQEAAALVQLQNLGREDAEQLLKSLFGEVPNLSQLAHRLHGLTAGNPRDLLGLAQHLVDHRVLSYEAGAWTLPAQIDESNLPSSMAQALRARLEQMPELVRQLAAVCALCPDQAFGFEECELLSERTAASLMLDLDELVNAQILRRVDDRFGISRPVWVGALRSLLTPALERSLERRLALVFERRGQDFRAGQHWLRAGEQSRGLDVLVAHARTSQHQTAKSSEAFYRYAEALPPDWFDTYQRSLQLCGELDRPARDAFTLRSRLAGIVPAFAVPDRGNADALLGQLVRDSGLGDWHALPDTLEPTERIRTALARAEARYAETPDRERVLPPSEAIGLFSRTLTSATGRVTVGMDVVYLRSMPDLRPFAPISPALALLSHLREGVEARYTGRMEQACEIYRRVLERTAQPDRAGLDASYCEFIRLAVMNALDIMEACMGLGGRRSFCAPVASHPAFHVNAMATRVVHQLFQGDIRAADQSRKHVERLRIEMRQLYDGSSLSWEIVAHTICEDLTRVRQALGQMEQLAQRFPGWRALSNYALAEYHRIRRDPLRAAQALENALALARPGEHMLWSLMAASQVRTLAALEHKAEAMALAERHLLRAQELSLGCMAEPLWQALALCQAQVGRAEAVQTAQASVARANALGVTGINLGVAYETCAKVALLLGDLAGFEDHAEACYEAYGCYRNPALLAKYRRLRQEAELQKPAPQRKRISSPDAYVSRTGIPIAVALDQCRSAAERARMALGMLITEAGARGGFLFSMGVEQAECLATVGEIALPDELLPRVTDYLLSQSQDTPTTSSDADDTSSSEWLDEVGSRYRPVLLCHDATDSWSVMGVALIALAETGVFFQPSRMASAISRYWADHGESALMFVNDG